MAGQAKAFPDFKGRGNGYNLYGERVQAFGTEVKRRRVELGVTQAALGKAVGVGRLRVVRLEGGRANPRLTELTLLAEVLGCRLTLWDGT